MESFIHLNKEIEFLTISGEVLSQDKYSETHISSSGGGGYVGKSGGYVSSPNITSTSVTNHEVWIKTKDGREVDLNLTDYNICLREGQFITLIITRIKGTDKTCINGVVNHNSKNYSTVNKADKVNEQLKIDQMSGKSLLIGAAIGAAISYIMELIGLSNTDVATVLTYGSAGLFMVYRYIKKWRRITSLHKEIDQHIDSIVQNRLYG